MKQCIGLQVLLCLVEGGRVHRGGDAVRGRLTENSSSLLPVCVLNPYDFHSECLNGRGVVGFAVTSSSFYNVIKAAEIDYVFLWKKQRLMHSDQTGCRCLQPS